MASEKVSLCRGDKVMTVEEGKKAPEPPEAPTNNEVLPPSSPDCNPLVYYVWSVVEGDVNKAPHNTRESLIVKIMEVFPNMSREEVALACKQFRTRLEKVIAANGDFIEYIYSSIFNKHCHKKLRLYLAFKYVFMREKKK